MDLKYSFPNVRAGSLSPALINILNIFGDYYGENRVDIENIKNEFYRIIIHFPEITITNSFHKTHIIKDIFASFCVNSSGVVTDRLAYGKSTYSIDELKAKYIHSHAPKADFLNTYGQFRSNITLRSVMNASFTNHVCTGGDTGLNQLFNNLSNEYDELLYTHLCVELDNAIRWESIEGGPFNRIANLGKSIDIPTSESHYEFKMLNTGLISVYRGGNKFRTNALYPTDILANYFAQEIMKLFIAYVEITLKKEYNIPSAFFVNSSASNFEESDVQQLISKINYTVDDLDTLSITIDYTHLESLILYIIVQNNLTEHLSFLLCKENNNSRQFYTKSDVLINNINSSHRCDYNYLSIYKIQEKFHESALLNYPKILFMKFRNTDFYFKVYSDRELAPHVGTSVSHNASLPKSFVYLVQYQMNNFLQFI